MSKISEIIDYVESGQTKLSQKALNFPGMTSPKVKNLLNKACSYPNTNYLEIGVYKGSTFYSALYGNKPNYAVAIDDFSEFDGKEETFLNNISDLDNEYKFINGECFSLDLGVFDHKINTYFYDGNHGIYSQERALTYYYDILDDTFIYICDDYDWEEVKAGTKSGIEKAGLRIIEERTLLGDDLGQDAYWNGIYIAELSKK